MLTIEQATEICRLSGLVSAARCRGVAVKLGHAGHGETLKNVEQRVERAAKNFLDYLKTITQE